MRYLLDNSNLPPTLQVPTPLYPQDCDRDAFIQLSDIKSDIVTYVNDGVNIYLMSRYTGNGKTTWASKLMLRYFDQVWAGNGFHRRGLFVHVPTFLVQLKSFGTKSEKLEILKEVLPKVDLVIWDDIASTELSAYDYSQLLMYIDNRIVNRKSNIFTGNIVKRDTMQKALGDKMTSRIWNSNTIIVEFKGGDNR